jgi:hypothetical protein
MPLFLIQAHRAPCSTPFSSCDGRSKAVALPSSATGPPCSPSPAHRAPRRYRRPTAFRSATAGPPRAAPPPSPAAMISRSGGTGRSSISSHMPRAGVELPTAKTSQSGGRAGARSPRTRREGGGEVGGWRERGEESANL